MVDKIIINSNKKKKNSSGKPQTTKKLSWSGSLEFSRVLLYYIIFRRYVQRLDDGVKPKSCFRICWLMTKTRELLKSEIFDRVFRTNEILVGNLAPLGLAPWRRQGPMGIYVGPDLGQTHKCCWCKLVNGVPTYNLDI